jgi:hypothetical protein
MARDLAGSVAQDYFIARRALEIYQLEEASGVHFDYGRIHPDDDHNQVLHPLERAQKSIKTILGMPVEVITWNRVYSDLNESLSSGFDVVHPAIDVVINDPAALAALRQGSGLKFSVGIGPQPASADLPNNIFEFKVDTLSLELTGARTSGGARMFIQHSGHWIMKRRTTPPEPPPPDIEFTLLPHVEIFNLAAGASGLTAEIPGRGQPAAEPGPPFSFWGRGALADWTLFTDTTAAPDLSSLTAVRLTIGCIGLIAQGTPAPAVAHVAAQPVAVKVQAPPVRRGLAGAA